MRTTNKAFKEQVRKHIKECLLDEMELQNYDIPFKPEQTTLQKQLTTVLHEFNNYYSIHEKRQHHYNTHNAFISFLKGLPTCLSVEFTYYNIEQELRRWFEACGVEYQKKPDFADLYYHLITREFIALCEQNKVPSINH